MKHPKHFFSLLAILFLCTPVFSQGVPHPANPRIMSDDLGNNTSPTYPLDVRDAAASSATASVTAKVEELRAQQATESADLLAATASETVLVASLEAVRQEVEDSGVNASETVIIAKLDELLTAAASDTLMITAIEAVGTAVAAVESALDPADIATQTVSLAAGVAQELTSGLTTRRSVYVGSQDANQDVPIWVNLGGSGTTGDGLLFFTGVEIPADESYTVWLVSSEAVDISVLEQGGI